MVNEHMFVWRMAGASHPGRVRCRNEDHVCLDEPHGLAVLADGMGGHAGGIVASRLTVLAWMEYMQQVVTSGRPGEDDLRAACTCANRAVCHAAAVEAGLRGMGSTLAGIHVTQSGQVFICHVGDSRVYRLRALGLQCLTRDHSVLREQVDAGMIAEEAAGAFALRGLLARAIGAEPEVLPDVTTGWARGGDVYLLCSDGLTEMVAEADIARVLVDLGMHPRLASIRLVEMANERGGVDNVSVVVVSSLQGHRPQGSVE